MWYRGTPGTMVTLRWRRSGLASVGAASRGGSGWSGAGWGSGVCSAAGAGRLAAWGWLSRRPEADQPAAGWRAERVRAQRVRAEQPQEQRLRAQGPQAAGRRPQPRLRPRSGARSVPGSPGAPGRQGAPGLREAVWLREALGPRGPGGVPEAGAGSPVHPRGGSRRSKRPPSCSFLTGDGAGAARAGGRGRQPARARRGLQAGPSRREPRPAVRAGRARHTRPLALAAPARARGASAQVEPIRAGRTARAA